MPKPRLGLNIGLVCASDYSLEKSQEIMALLIECCIGHKRQ